MQRVLGRFQILRPSRDWKGSRRRGRQPSLCTRSVDAGRSLEVAKDGRVGSRPMRGEFLRIRDRRERLEGPRDGRKAEARESQIGGPLLALESAPYCELPRPICFGRYSLRRSVVTLPTPLTYAPIHFPPFFQRDTARRSC
jgi:hypothetical protein